MKLYHIERGHPDQAIDYPESAEFHCISGTRLDLCDPYLVLVATKGLEEMGIHSHETATEADFLNVKDSSLRPPITFASQLRF